MSNDEMNTRDNPCVAVVVSNVTTCGLELGGKSANETKDFLPAICLPCPGPFDPEDTPYFTLPRVACVARIPHPRCLSYHDLHFAHRKKRYARTVCDDV